MKRAVSTLASLSLATAASAQIQSQKLKASDPDFGDAFGWGVGISGATPVVAAPTDAPGVSGAGSVYVFDLVGGLWVQTAKGERRDTRSALRRRARIP